MRMVEGIYLTAGSVNPCQLLASVIVNHLTILDLRDLNFLPVKVARELLITGIK